MRYVYYIGILTHIQFHERTDKSFGELENFRYKRSYCRKINLLFTEMVMLTKTTKLAKLLMTTLK